VEKPNRYEDTVCEKSSPRRQQGEEKQDHSSRTSRGIENNVKFYESTKTFKTSQLRGKTLKFLLRVLEMNITVVFSAKLGHEAEN
jgi:hypothetical protein